MKVQSIYSNRILKKGLKLAAENGSLFDAAASLAFSTVRPLAILTTPNTDKKNKQYASTKAIASTLTSYLLLRIISTPIADAVKNIDKAPGKYLKKTTIQNLKTGEKNILNSRRYILSTQLFKLGVGFLTVIPKAILVAALIPPIMHKLFPQKHASDINSNNITFTGLANTGTSKVMRNVKTQSGIYANFVNKISKVFGKAIDSDFIQNISNKFQNTRFEQHIISLTDIFATGAFINQINKNNKIEKKRRKTLIYNSILSTGFAIGGSYIIDSLTKKPTKKFIKNFKIANINDPNLSKYVEGIRVAKPVMLLGILYYIFIPIVSTFLADRVPNKQH